MEKTVKSFVFRHIANHNWLIPLNSHPDKLFELNSTATQIWNLLTQNFTITKTAKTISEIYNIPIFQAKSDIISFINNLKSDSDHTSFITTSNFEEKLLQQRLPLFAGIELTGKCNLNCVHCYAAELRHTNDLDTKTWYFIIDQLVDSGCLFIHFSGGECFLRSDFADIYLYARRHGLIPTVSTNATLTNPAIIHLFKHFPPKLVKISLYGASPQTHDQITQHPGSFASTIKAVEKLKQNHINVLLSGVIMKSNFKELDQMKILSSRLNTPIFFYDFLLPTLSGQPHPLDLSLRPVDHQRIHQANMYFAQTSDHCNVSPPNGLYPCSAGQTSFHINNSGDLTLCKMDRRQKISLLTTTFLTAWKSLSSKRKNLLSPPPACRKCSLTQKCTICPPIYRLLKKSDNNHLACKKNNFQLKSVCGQ